MDGFIFGLVDAESLLFQFWLNREKQFVDGHEINWRDSCWCIKPARFLWALRSYHTNPPPEFHVWHATLCDRAFPLFSSQHRYHHWRYRRGLAPPDFLQTLGESRHTHRHCLLPTWCSSF